MAKEYIITADSEPDLDEWGYDDYWLINNWIEWHKMMKKKYGVEIANSRFIQWWNKQSSGANPIDARSFNSVFRNYAKENKFLDNLFSGASWVKPIGAGTDIISSGSDAISNVSE